MIWLHSDFILTTFWLHPDYILTTRQDKKTKKGQKKKAKKVKKTKKTKQINDLYRSIALRWLLISGALFIVRWSCCFKCALSVLWRSYSKTWSLWQFFADGTRLRHSWGQRGGRRRSLYDAHGTERSDDVNWLWFLRCHYCLKPIFCQYDAQETHDFEIFKIVITTCETHIRQNVAIFTKMM